MTTPTSKSASATPATSSPSGTSAKTAGTARKVPKARGKFAPLVERLRGMSPTEFRQSLVNAGIITEAGELTPHYQPKPAAKRKKKAG